jgi:membrane associated rhomboid family serine protease
MRFEESLITPIRFVFIIWASYALSKVLPFDLAILGIYPRSFSGMIGILLAPMIHGSLLHLISNTLPLLFLGIVLFLFYDKIAKRVFFQCYFITNILVWIFARPSLHIGASGLVYGIASFLIFYFLFRNDFKSLVISIIILILYGGMVYGIFPQQSGVSWESHLMGVLVGLITASQLAKAKAVAT